MANISVPPVATPQPQPALDRDRWYVLIVLTAVYALNIADRFVVNTLIDPIRREFDLTDMGVGLLTGGSVALFYVTSSIPIAVFADRTSRQRLLAIAIAAWSVLTAACGVSHSFWQLFAARVGVGVGEAGATPISQSLLSDKFPAAARSFSLSLFALGAAAGAALGASLGGMLNDSHGWRAALLVFGLMGLPLAVIVALTVREPSRGKFDSQIAESSPSLAQTVRFMMSQRAMRHLFWGSSVVTLWSWGLIWWTPTFLLRTHGMSLTDSGRELGWVHAVGGCAVTLGTAWSMKILSNKDPRYQVWFVAIATLAATPAAFLAYTTHDPHLCILMLWLFIPASYAFSGPSYALAQNLVPATMRARSCALILFTANITNLIVAPVMIGEASDLLAPRLAVPAQSLGIVLAICTATGIWGAWHYIAAGRYLRADLISAGSFTAVSHGSRSTFHASSQTSGTR